jgi:hypothetical protein
LGLQDSQEFVPDTLFVLLEKATALEKKSQVLKPFSTAVKVQAWHCLLSLQEQEHSSLVMNWLLRLVILSEEIDI